MPAPASNFVHLFYKKNQEKLFPVAPVTKPFGIGIGIAIGNRIFHRQCWFAIAIPIDDWEASMFQSSIGRACKPIRRVI
jgi:hypothetical protein